MAQCQSPGCVKRSAGYSRYCNSCKARDGRHGDPRQETVTAFRLKPYIQSVRGWVARQRQDNLWQLFEVAWRDDVDHARAVLAEYRAGRPSFRHEVQAADDLVKVSGDVTARTAVETILAIAAMQQWEPRTFRSDRAFWCQAARRFRGLSDVHVGSYWDHKQGRVKRVYRDPKPKAGEALGRMLMRSLGAAGRKIAMSEQAAVQRRADAAANLLRAMDGETRAAARG